MQVRTSEGGYDQNVYAAYPECAQKMFEYRMAHRQYPPHTTDCDFQYLVHAEHPGLRPMIPSHFNRTTPSEIRYRRRMSADGRLVEGDEEWSGEMPMAWEIDADGVPRQASPRAREAAEAEAAAAAAEAAKAAEAAEAAEAVAAAEAVEAAEAAEADGTEGAASTRRSLTHIHHTTALDTTLVVINGPAVDILRLPPPPPCVAPTGDREIQLGLFQCDTRPGAPSTAPSTAPFHSRPSTELSVNSRRAPACPGAPRLQAVPGTYYVLLDCVPWLMRAICYSPVPFGEDPSYSEPYGDYFTDQ